MRIPFVKAHGAKNDFLLTWASDAPRDNLPASARAICDRRTGVGADGWLLVRVPTEKPPECEGVIRLFNADGSEAEISGNGTRCAAAFLMDAALVKGDRVRISTGAGVKHLRLLERHGLAYSLEMRMGVPAVAEGGLRFRLPLESGEREVSLLNLGNPQCAVFVDNLDFDWPTLGAEIEAHPLFPNRTNVSFVRLVDQHSLDVRFYERGVGVTMSSGTGSTGGAAAAILRGLAQSPVRVLTPAGPLDIRWDDDMYLTGPAEIVAAGEFYL
jgi:diaminopimelate epimerase